MDKYGDSIYSDESQASELVRNVVKTSIVAQLPVLPGAEYSLQDDYATHDSPRPSLSQYQLPGLGITQSQLDGVSGKTTVVRDELSASWDAPSLDTGPVNHSVVARAQWSAADDQSVLSGVSVDNEIAPEKAIDAPPSRSALADGFPEVSQRTRADNAQMPSPTPTPPSHHVRDAKRKRKPRKRSLSPLSDDSFAGSLPTDLQHKRYIATSKAFNIPLSQLGNSQDTSFEDSRRDDDELSTASTEDIPAFRRGLESMSRSSAFRIPASEPDQSEDEDDSCAGQAQLPEDDDYSRDDSHLQRSLEFPSSAEAQVKMKALLANSGNQNGPLPSSTFHDLQGGVAAGEPSTESLPQVATQTESDIPDPLLQQTGASGTSVAHSMMSLIDPAKLHRYIALLPTPHPNHKLIPQQPEAVHASHDSKGVPSSANSTGSAPHDPVRVHRHSSSPPPPPVLESEAEETQITSSANLPATGHISPPTIHSHSEPVEPSDFYPYDETQPSTASNLPPTGERITRELGESPLSKANLNRGGLFSNLAKYSSEEIVPDSEAAHSDYLRNPTMSPVIPYPDPTPPGSGEPSSLTGQPIARSPIPKTPKKVSPRLTRPQDRREVIPDSVAEDTDVTEEEEVREAVGRSAGKEEEEEEEESSEEEDSIPLAQIVGAHNPSSSAVVQGKRSRGLSHTLMPPPSKKEKTASGAAAVTRATRSHGVAAQEVIPSSVSLERNEKPKVTRKPTQGKTVAAPKNKGKGKATLSAKSKGKGKKAVTPKPMTPIREQASDTDVEEEGDQSREGTIADEQRTEAADEDAGISADDSLPAPGTSSRKRKRGVPTPSTRSVRSSTHAGGSTTKKLTRATTTTPSTARPAKRIKVESVEELKKSGATRVMALWKADLYYYPGTVLSQTASGMFCVKFDDGYEGEASIQDMRALEFRPKDDVYFIAGGPKGVDLGVVVASVEGEQEMVVVEDDIYRKKYEVPVSKLKVFNRTVKHEWDDRRLALYQIEPYEKPTKVSTPSGRSVTSSGAPNSGSYHKSRLLAKLGFAVTLNKCDGVPDWRSELNDMITAHGGTIISDWGDLFTMNGTRELQGKRWTLTMEEVKGPKDGKIDTVFLLANEPNHKPKFLMALALGIPCLDVRWLDDSVRDNERKPWPGYLLHTGSSEVIDAQISQMVDYNWGRCKSYVTNIMDNPVAIKLFNGKRILCVSPAFVPSSRKGSVSDVGEAESKEMVPRIILCMGASVVEAVTSLTYASGQNFEEDYDYIVIEPKAYPDITKRVQRFSNWVPFTWVKECLITGRLLPKLSPRVGTPHAS